MLEKKPEKTYHVLLRVFRPWRKKQKKQQGTGCSSQFYLDYSLAFLYPNKFRGPYHFKDLMRKTIGPKVGRISAWRWNPWSIGNPRWWRKFENGVQQLFCVWRLGLFWRKNLFQTYQASLCHMENAGTLFPTNILKLDVVFRQNIQSLYSLQMWFRNYLTKHISQKSDQKSFL